MPSSKKGTKVPNSKKTTKKDDHASSSDDEVVLERKKVTPKGGKVRAPSHPKDEKKTVADNRYTPIVEQCYQCFTLSTVPADMHRVSVDVYCLMCQLYELWCVRERTTTNFSVKLQYLVRFKACLIAVILNIAKGCRYSDIPTQVVDCITRTAVSVHKDDLDVLHMCSVPKGRVYISRGNRSLAALAAIINMIPLELNEQTYRAFKGSMETYLNSKGVGKYFVSPPQGQDEEIAKKRPNEAETTIIESGWFNLAFREQIMMLNASVVENPDFVLYQPVVCNLEDVAYLEVRGLDSVLVTFSEVSNENVLKRLRIMACGIRFFIGFTRVWKQNKVFIDAWKIDGELAQIGMIAVLEKYKLVSPSKRMEDDSTVEEIRPMEKKETKVVKTITKWQPTDYAYINLVSSDHCTAISELPALIKEGRQARITSTKILVVRDDTGETGVTALVAQPRQVARTGAGFKYFLWKGNYSSGDYTTDWLDFATPEHAAAVAKHIPKLD